MTVMRVVNVFTLPVSLTTEKNASQHMRVHTGEKPYKNRGTCFSYASVLSRHMRFLTQA